MRLRVLAAAIIFAGSYLPLSLILLAQNFEYARLQHPFCWGWAIGNTAQCAIPFKNPGFASGIFIACLVCFILTLGVLALIKLQQEIIIQESKYVPADLINYTLPYIVSFMSIDYQDSGKFVGLIIFLGWMFWITYKSGQIIMNPLLTAFGWRLYEISYNFPGNDRKHSGRVLARIAIMPGGRYRQTAVQDVLVIKASSEQAGG